MPGSVSRSDLQELLARWTVEELISGEQAVRIEAAEAARAAGAAQAQAVSEPARVPGQPGAAGAAGPDLPTGPAAAAPPAAAHAVQRRPLVVEALGYVGGVLALVAGALAVGMLWPGIPVWAELAFTGAAAAALGAGGALVRTGGDPAFGRLRGTLWLMATAGLAGFTSILTAQVFGARPLPTVVTTFAVATVTAAGFWWLTRSAVQELALFASAATLTGAVISWAVDIVSPWPSGLGLWLLSAAWAVAVTRGYLGPRGAGYLAAGVGLLIGAQLTMGEAAGQVLAVATVAGLLAAGVLLRRVLVVALGAVGVLEVIPQTAARYLPSSVSAPLSVLAVALVILACALWLAKRWAHTSH